MKAVITNIVSCKECPYMEKTNPYSTDGWDLMEDWVCTLKKEKIAGAVEWHEEDSIEIPEWCPLPDAKSVKTYDIEN